jgi:hypothetical protein
MDESRSVPCLALVLEVVASKPGRGFAVEKAVPRHTHSGTLAQIQGDTAILAVLNYKTRHDWIELKPQAWMLVSQCAIQEPRM